MLNKLVGMGVLSLSLLLLGCQREEETGFRLLYSGVKGHQSLGRGITVSMGCLQEAEAQGISRQVAAMQCTSRAATGTQGAVRGSHNWSIWWWPGWNYLVSGCQVDSDGSYRCLTPEVEVYYPQQVHPVSFFSWCGLSWWSYCQYWGTCNVTYNSWETPCSRCLTNYENEGFNTVRGCLWARGCPQSHWWND